MVQGGLLGKVTENCTLTQTILTDMVILSGIPACPFNNICGSIEIWSSSRGMFFLSENPYIYRRHSTDVQFVCYPVGLPVDVEGFCLSK